MDSQWHRAWMSNQSKSPVITQKDSYGQREEDSSWLNEVVQPNWSFLPSGKWQLRQAYSMSWLPSHYPCSVTKIRKWTRQNKADFSKTSLKTLTDPLDLTNQPCGTLVIDGGWLLYMVKLEQQQTWQEMQTVTWTMCIVWAVAPISLWSLMATADHQKIMTTSGVPRTSAVISRFDQIWFTGPQEQSSWITLVTSVSSSTSSFLSSKNITSLWSSVTMMLTLRLWKRHWLCFRLLCWGQWHLCLYYFTTRLVGMEAGVVSKEEFLQFIFNPYLEWFIMLCVYCSIFRCGQKMQMCW